MGNLLDLPTHRIADRIYILSRAYAALFENKDAVTSFQGLAHRWTEDEITNWLARETIVRLIREL